MLKKILGTYDKLANGLSDGANGAPLLFLRIILFWEFWQAGTEKLHGSNWFSDIPWASWQVGFPFPFDQIPLEINWYAAMWGELIFSVLLLLGLFTRLSAFSLIVINIVAMVSVHWPANWGEPS